MTARTDKPCRGRSDQAVDCYAEARWQIDQAYKAKAVGRPKELRFHVNEARRWVRRSRYHDRRS